ncbi:hypothetical protein WN48_08163 [Eufriesea mexicana]|uniref:Uncharacterized protein n=1 Tax=Eufriesea mexicana TaxID=516756 RepID=A0A310S7Z9_9HYME|nr:hypothetical protein WN48_08163 [Eufriesea mexicana]
MVSGVFPYLAVACLYTPRTKRSSPYIDPWWGYGICNSVEFPNLRHKGRDWIRGRQHDSFLMSNNIVETVFQRLTLCTSLSSVTRHQFLSQELLC